MRLALGMAATLSLFAQTGSPPQVAIRDNGIWVEQSGVAPLRASENSSCNAIDRVEWIGSNRIAIDCHINPSLSQYFEVDLTDRRTTKDLLGYWFTRSPQGNKVAHVGWIPHFAPPFAKSNYLQIDGKTVYPGVNGAGSEPNAAEQKGSLYVGVHEFLYGLNWSPDGKLVAFAERIYDWQPDSPNSNSGRELNQKHLLVTAGEGQKPLAVEIPAPTGEPRIVWQGSDTVTYSTAGVQQTFRIDHGRLIN